MKNKIILLVICLSLFSCTNKNKVYDKTFSFSQNRWNQEDKKTFEFEIKETGNYNINFLFSHIYDYQFVKIPLLFEIKNEKNKIETLPIELQIKDKDGKELAECSGDYCDLNYILKQNTLLNKGKYKIYVSNTFEFPYLANVIAIGISVEKVSQ